ncbi:MAG: hypothetical protein ABSG41_25690 [Bryobacteraceae bacterium]
MVQTGWWQGCNDSKRPAISPEAPATRDEIDLIKEAPKCVAGDATSSRVQNGFVFSNAEINLTTHRRSRPTVTDAYARPTRIGFVFSNTETTGNAGISFNIQLEYKEENSL